jgi:hypothetical protein
MKFSDRIGITKQKDVIQMNGIDDILKNKLWNIFFTYLILPLQNDKNSLLVNTSHYKFFVNLWHNYFGKPIDTIPQDKAIVISDIRIYFFECKWYEIYNIIDFVSENIDLFDKNKFRDSINIVLETEFSAYRFVGEELVLVENGERFSEIAETKINNDIDDAIAKLENELNILKNSKGDKILVSTEDMISAIEPFDLNLTDNNNDSNTSKSENAKDFIESTKSVKEKLGLRSEDRDAFLTLKSNPAKTSGEIKKGKNIIPDTSAISSSTIADHNNHSSSRNKSLKSGKDESAEKKEELDKALSALKQRTDTKVNTDSN